MYDYKKGKGIELKEKGRNLDEEFFEVNTASSKKSFTPFLIILGIFIVVLSILAVIDGVGLAVGIIGTIVAPSLIPLVGYEKLNMNDASINPFNIRSTAIDFNYTVHMHNLGVIPFVVEEVTVAFYEDGLKLGTATEKYETLIEPNERTDFILECAIRLSIFDLPKIAELALEYSNTGNLALNYEGEAKGYATVLGQRIEWSKTLEGEEEIT